MFVLLSVLGQSEAKESVEVSPTEREQYTCEGEAKRFGSWASLAGRLDPDRLKADHPGVQLVEVKVADGRIIRGVAVKGDMPPKNAVLVIGGNGWSAKSFVDAVLPHFSSFDADVYYFDFRGYGMSTPANPTMHAIVEDYRDIAKWLVSEGHDRLYLYWLRTTTLRMIAACRLLPLRRRKVGMKCLLNKNLHFSNKVS